MSLGQGQMSKMFVSLGKPLFYPLAQWKQLVPATLYNVIWITALNVELWFNAGIHAVCDGGGRSLVGGTGPHVLQCQGCYEVSRGQFLMVSFSLIHT